MKNVIRLLVVVFVSTVPQTAEAITDMVCGLASRTVSASILGVVANPGGPTVVLTGLTVASAAALGCRLIVSRATPAIIAALAPTVGPLLPGTWITATAAASAVAPPIGAAIIFGAVVGTAGTLLVVHAVPFAWNALPDHTRTALTSWISARWEEVTRITLQYGRSLYSGIGTGLDRVKGWVQTLISTIAPEIYAQTFEADRGRYLHVFPPYEVQIHIRSLNSNPDLDYWAFPAPGM